MPMHRSDTVKTGLMDALNAARGGDAQIQLRTGAASAIPDQGTLLATLTGATGSWGTASGGVLTSGTITSDPAAAASGTVGHYQINTSGGTFVESGDIDTEGVTISSTTVTAGQAVDFTGAWTNTAAY